MTCKMKTVCLGDFAILFWIGDRIIKSYAFQREFNFAPFGSTKGSGNVFSNGRGKSLK